MVQIVHGGDNCIKINTIIIAAQKRFGLFGLEKTTMKEIASDLGMSKASLYYYFPDKESLMKAVVEMEQESFLEIVNRELSLLTDPREQLRKFQDLRHTYFRTFFNLGRLRHDEIREIKPILSTLLANFMEKEETLIEKIIEEGNRMKIFNISNPRETGSLYIELLKGLRLLSFQKKDYLYVENAEYELLSSKQKAFVEMFINAHDITK